MVDARHSRISVPIPPDYEERHTLALALCEHLGINPQHVELGSLRIELGPDHQHQVTWTGHTHLDLADLTGILMQAKLGDRTPDDYPDDYPTQCRAQLPADYDHPHPGVAHYCHLTAGHTDNHLCGICATSWEPNRA